MKLVKFSHIYDFGHSWYLQILKGRNRTLFQTAISWNDFPDFPYFQVKFGGGCLFSIIFFAYKFGFDIGIIEYTWYYDDHIDPYKENYDE